MTVDELAYRIYCRVIDKRPEKWEDLGKDGRAFYRKVARTAMEALKVQPTGKKKPVDKRWREAALLAVRRAATIHGTFTTDDVFELIDQSVPQPDDPRAIGPVMQDAVAGKLCRKTDRFRRSRRPQNHGRPCRVWEGLGQAPADHPVKGKGVRTI